MPKSIILMSILSLYLVSCFAQQDSLKIKKNKGRFIDTQDKNIDKKTYLKIDAEIDTSLYIERKRCIYPFSPMLRYSCNYNYLGNPPINQVLLNQLQLCTFNNPDTSDEFAYHLRLKNCDDIENNDIRIFTFDKDQKDSSLLLVTICEGDLSNGRRLSDSWGAFLVFKREKVAYQLTDIGFGKIVAFDFDKYNRMHPIVYGETENAKRVAYDEMKPQTVVFAEVRLSWDGTHLKANEVVGAEFIGPNNSVENTILSISEMKKRKLYNSVKRRYAKKRDDILRGVKIHWRYRSYTLMKRKTDKHHKNDEYYESEKWKNGFKID